MKKEEIDLKMRLMKTYGFQKRQPLLRHRLKKEIARIKTEENKK